MTEPNNISVDSQLKQAYDNQYKNYDAEWRRVNALSKANHIINMCKNITPFNILEVGSGDGAILQTLSEKQFGKELYSIDISESGIEITKNRNIPNLKQAQVYDGYKIPFPDQFFDLVICSHVMEHVEHPRMLLREIQRVSKKQFFEIPIDYSQKCDKKVVHFLNYGHINMFNPALFKFLLISEQFKIITDKPDLYNADTHKLINTQIKKTKNSVAYFKYVLALTVKHFLWRIAPKKYKYYKPEIYYLLTEKNTQKISIM